MSRIKSLGGIIFVALVLALIVWSGPACGGGGAAPTPTPTAAATPTPTAIVITPSTITSVSGQVFVLEPGASAWVDAIEGADLEAGDSVQTGDNGYVCCAGRL